MPLLSSGLDYVAAIGTGIGALAAAGAVIVALFGPGWREKQKRPTLSLSLDPLDATVSPPGDPGPPVEMRIRIHNAAGRDTAEQVEVFTSVTSRDRPGLGMVVVAQDENLNFDSPFGGGPGRSTATVPSGHSRPISFALFGQREEIEKRIARSRGELAVVALSTRREREWAALSLYGLSTEMRWLRTDRTYDVVLVVAGANFDALTFGGQVRLAEEHAYVNEHGETVDEDGLESNDGIERVEWMAFKWLGPLHRGSVTTAKDRTD